MKVEKIGIYERLDGERGGLVFFGRIRLSIFLKKMRKTEEGVNSAI